MGRWWLAWVLCGGCGLITPVGVPDELVDKDGVVETDAVQESPVGDTYEGSWDTDRGDTDESPSDTDKGQDSSSWPDSGDSGHSGFPGGGGGTGTCGDGVRGGYEDCDGADLSGLTCATLGLGGGALACSSACFFDRRGCSPGPQRYCTDDCFGWSNDQDCDDGGRLGPAASFGFCTFGTDCSDCGPRTTAGTFCNDSCIISQDGRCDDGGPGSSSLTSGFCDLGTDCSDCGPR